MCISINEGKALIKDIRFVAALAALPGEGQALSALLRRLSAKLAAAAAHGGSYTADSAAICHSHTVLVKAAGVAA